jgi:hypothetical protein
MATIVSRDHCSQSDYDTGVPRWEDSLVGEPVRAKRCPKSKTKRSEGFAKRSVGEAKGRQGEPIRRVPDVGHPVKHTENH